VGLSSELGRWVRDPARGVKVAIGTGAAYLVVNLPPLFSGSPQRQAIAAAVAAGVGLIAEAMPERRVGQGGLFSPSSARGASSSRWLIEADDARGRGLAAVVLVFVALVGLDSAAFAIIQDAAALKVSTWGSGAQSLRMGVLHLAGALAAGLLLDRRRFFPLLVGVYALFAAGLGLLQGGVGSGVASGALYAIGIGAYSVALVLYPSGGAEGPGLTPRQWRAAAVYGVGGWLGSALGVALAERHQRIPIALVWLAGTLVAAAALLRRRRLPAPVVESFGLALLCGAVAIWIHGVAPLSAAPATRSADRRALAVDGPASLGAAPPGELGAGAGPAVAPTASVAAKPPDPRAIARGRAVYIAEGCQHCHSQYIRAAGADRVLWGPLRPGAGAGDPPLYGVRRQGPDLANVGNRRSASWQRVHLIDPRGVSPTSRMPSYAHLFATARGRGDDVIAYLESLGAATGVERFRDLQARPIHVAAASFDRGGELFALYCAGCHGALGRGDGALAPVFDRKPGLDLGRGTFALVSFGPGIGTFEEGLARVIRFGVPGTSMPGHEHLDDGEVSALVAHVRALGGGRP
jgi:cytochrome c oxidase cbb3-type subunit 2